MTVKKKAKKKVVKVKTHLDCTKKEDALARCVAVTSKPAAQCYLDSGYSDMGANNHVQVYKTLQKPYVAERVDFYRQMVEAKLDIRDERIIAEFAAVAFLDPVEVFEIPKDGKIYVKSLDEIPPWARRAIASFKQTERSYGRGDDLQTETTIEVKFHSKVAALTKLAELKNMFERNNRSKAPRLTFNLKYREA